MPRRVCQSDRVPALTLGVEEEFQLVDAATGMLVSRGAQVLAAVQPAAHPPAEMEVAHEASAAGEVPATAPAAAVVGELPLSQVETVTGVCANLAEVRRQVGDLRALAGRAAERAGCRIVAAGTPPAAVLSEQRTNPGERYRSIVARYGYLVAEQVIAGMHVHVGVPDPAGSPGHDLARVAVLDGLRPWLAVLTAMAANSPYWMGVDSGYASYRTVHWWRWPTTGPPPHAGTPAAYSAAVDDLVRTTELPDATWVYWDARLSLRWPTVEVRAMDVCASLDDAVTVAGVVQGLAGAALADAAAGRPAPEPRPEVLRAASWRAASEGLSGRLVDPTAAAVRPAGEVLDALLARVRAPLEATGDYTEVEQGVRRLQCFGTGAERQRVAYAEGGLSAVARMLAAETIRR